MKLPLELKYNISQYFNFHKLVCIFPKIALDIYDDKDAKYLWEESCMNGYINTIKWFIYNNKLYGYSPMLICLAVYNNNLEIIKFIQKNIKNDYEWATFYEDDCIIETYSKSERICIIHHNVIVNGIISAINLGYLDIIKFLYIYNRLEDDTFMRDTHNKFKRKYKKDISDFLNS